MKKSESISIPSIISLTNTNENNLVAFYLVFVEFFSRFQFYGKSERKHVKYFLKCTIYKNCAEKVLIEQKNLFKFSDQSLEPFGSDQFGNSTKFPKQNLKNPYIF